MKVDGSTFFITGGGSGLGAACARLFAENGGNILIADVQEKVSQQLAAELGSRAKFVLTDVTDEASVQNALEAARQEFGSVQVAVNCAGIASAGRVVGKEGPHDLKAFSRTIQVNLIGTFNVIRLAAVAMSGNGAERRPGTRRDHQHRIGSRIRRTDWPGCLLGFQGGRGVDDAAHRP